MKKCDVPEYLHGSGFYTSLSDDDSSDIIIPDKCCKPDENVASPEDLEHLLFTIRFWGLNKIPYSCIEYIIVYYDEEGVFEVLREFESDFYLYKFACGFENVLLSRDFDGLAEWAAECGATDILRYCPRLGAPISVTAQASAIKSKNFECFKIAYEAHNSFIPDVCELAAKYGCSDVLQFAHGHGAPWRDTLEKCARSSSLDCLKYALEHGCPGIGRAVEVAATSGHLDILQCLLTFDNGSTRFANLSYNAARGNVDCLQYVFELGYRVDTQTLVSAAQSGKLECMQFAHANGALWTEEVIAAAVHGEDAACFIYAHQSGGPLPAGTAELAAERGCSNHLAYLFALTPDRPVSISIAAAKCWSDCVLRFVRDNGCPMDMEVFRSAARCGGQPRESGETAARAIRIPTLIQAIKHEMKKTDIPEYLHGSDFFKSLSDGDNSDILVPEDCCKANTDVSTLGELRHLLSTMRFWCIKEIPAPCIKFIIDNSGKDVHDVLHEFNDQFYLYRFARGFNAPFQVCAVQWAVSCNAIEVVSYYHSIGRPIDESAQPGAIRNGNFKLFRYLYEITGKFADDVCEKAVEHNRLDILQFAHEQGTDWGQSLGLCVIYRSFKCMQYALEHGCPRIEDAVRLSATTGEVRTLTYLLDFDKGATPFPKLASYAARGNLQCLRLVHERGYPMDSLALVEAAEKGHLDSMKYCREHGVAWTETVATAAVRYGTVECFAYARESGCPLPAGLLELAARRERIDHLKYMFELSPERPIEVSLAAAAHEFAKSLRFVHSQGCPVNLEVMRIAARTGGDRSLHYLHKEVQLPWDASVFAAAAAGGYMFIVKYLHENGCPWDSNTCTTAALTGHLDCLRFACENGCDRAGLVDMVTHPSLRPEIRQYLEQLQVDAAG